MAKPAICFGLSYGLSGCYMPDSYYGAFRVTTRRELMDAVRDAIETYELPKSLMRQVRWRDVWHHAKRHGGVSTLHFSMNHKGNALSFHGLTEAELEDWEAAND